LAIKEKIDVQPSTQPVAPKEEKVKEIDVDKEETKKGDDTEVDDDEDDDGSF